jgi:hypothetical protein
LTQPHQPQQHQQARDHLPTSSLPPTSNPQTDPPSSSVPSSTSSSRNEIESGGTLSQALPNATSSDDGQSETRRAELRRLYEKVPAELLGLLQKDVEDLVNHDINRLPLEGEGDEGENENEIGQQDAGNAPHTEEATASTVSHIIPFSIT